jgi:phospholipase C
MRAARQRPILWAAGVFALLGVGLVTAVVVARLLSTGPPIQHIVIIVKENRSFDNMFGRFPGADGTLVARENGRLHRMGITPDSVRYDLGHGDLSSLNALDHGKMDGFWRVSHAFQHHKDIADSEMDKARIPDYWAYARTFGLADHFFSTIAASSFPNHLVTVAGYSMNTVDNPMTQQYKNPNSWGCDAQKGTFVDTFTNVASRVFPCFSGKTLVDEANAAHVSWKYYPSFFSKRTANGRAQSRKRPSSVG